MRKALAWLAIAAAFVVLYGRDVSAQVSPPVPSYRYGEQPVVFIPNIDNWVLTETALAHYWNFSDSPGGTTPGPCPSTMADLVAQDTVASATPSAVPLNVSTPTPGPIPVCGATSMVQDGSTAAELTNTIAAAQGQWFSPATAGILSNLCNANAGGSCVNDFSVECVVDPGNIASASYFFSADGTTNGLAIGASFANGLILLDRGVAIQNFALTASGHPYDILYTFAHATSTSTVYMNGVEADAVTSPVPQASANSVTYFGSETGAAAGWNGRIEKCGLYNAALTAAQARAHYNATGLW